MLVATSVIFLEIYTSLDSVVACLALDLQFICCRHAHINPIFIEKNNQGGRGCFFDLLSWPEYWIWIAYQYYALVHSQLASWWIFLFRCTHFSCYTNFLFELFFPQHMLWTLGVPEMSLFETLRDWSLPMWGWYISDMKSYDLFIYFFLSVGFHK